MALFEREGHEDDTAIAVGAMGKELLAWRAHLDAHDLALRVTDRNPAYSLYFQDPVNNLHEITTCERDYVAERLT